MGRYGYAMPRQVRVDIAMPCIHKYG